jgi:hypothetical protein
MKWHRRPSLLTFILTGLAVCIGVEMGALLHYGSTSRRTVSELGRDQREMSTLTASSPAPVAQNAALIESDVARTAASLAAIEDTFCKVSDAADRMNRAVVPTGRSEAFFDIAAFVEALRNRAALAGVVLKPDERFGFSAYVNEAPLAGQIADVFRARQVVQYLVEALIDARPRELLSVQWERPADELTAGRARTSASALARRPPAVANEGDYFVIDPRLSAGTTGIIATRGFRLSFTGHTATLRTLLNRLAGFELPLVVRAVEVAPPERPSLRRLSTEPAALVVPTWSRFTVTVEFLELPKLRPTAS